MCETPKEAGFPQIDEAIRNQRRRGHFGGIEDIARRRHTTWVCSICTFENTGTSDECEMCGTARPVDEEASEAVPTELQVFALFVSATVGASGVVPPASTER